MNTSKYFLAGKTRNTTIIFILFLCFFVKQIIAQEAIFSNDNIVSPELNDDKSITLRFFAPNADSVKVTGDFLPTIKRETQWGIVDAPSQANLTKDKNGVWSFTSKPLEPELYNYSFIVDGISHTDPNNPFLIRDVASVTNIFIIGGEQADLYKVNDVPHGTVSRIWYDSPGLNMDRRLTVYTPPNYEKSESTKYPVLYLLHGAGGDEEAWIELGRTAQIMDNLIASGKAKPMIVVMPNANIFQDAAPGQGNKGYYKPQFMAQGTMNGTYEATFKDIISFVENNYRVKAQKESRAIAGLSMGGFHSLHISRYYPNTFDYIGLFSAAILPNENASSEVYSNFEESLKRQKANGYKLYWIAIGKTDFLYEANQEFIKKLDEINMPYEYLESEGGHIWRNWRIYLSKFAQRLF